MTGKFRITAPTRHDGFYMVKAIRRDPPAGGAASGRTAEEAREQAMTIVAAVLAVDAEVKR